MLYEIDLILAHNHLIPLVMNSKPTTFTLVFLLIFSMLSCSSDDDSFDTAAVNEDPSDNTSIVYSEADEDALRFMLEEEKLARDTYNYLFQTWGINQFKNIRNSEQSHMDAVASLLDSYSLDYVILPEGQFSIVALQDLYDQFVVDGSISAANARQIGATIEDLDIVDLQNNIEATENTDVIQVFERLQCGSRNHLRSFMNAIDNNGETYLPQFLSQSEFDAILNANQEQCNQ
jgi:hypothetical protein